VAFSPDGNTLASGSDDKSVKIVNPHSAKLIHSIDLHSDWVRCLAFSPDGNTLASGSDDKSVKLVRWADATLQQTLIHPAMVISIAFSPDGKTLASAAADGAIRLWDVASGRLRFTLLHLPDGWVAYRPDGCYKYAGNVKGSFWHLVGLCRFEVDELEEYWPTRLRLALDEPFD